MKPFLPLLLLGCLAVFASSPALAAQPGTRAELRAWASCLAKSDTRTARKIVLGEPGAVPQAVKGGFFSRQSCAAKAEPTAFQGLTFLGPIAEFVLTRDFPDAPKFTWDPLADRLEADLTKALATNPPRFDSPGAIATSRSYIGLCLLKRNAPASTAFLASEIESETEREHFVALQADIETCGVAGQPVPMAIDDLRANIAIARYRLLRAASRGADHA